MSRKPPLRIRFEPRSPSRTTSRPRASRQTTLCLQTTSSCSRRKRWRSPESRPGSCWSMHPLHRFVPCHSVGGRSSDSSCCSGLHSTYSSSLVYPHRTNGASRKVAPKRQFPLVREAVLVCSYDDLGTLALCRPRTPEQSPFNAAQSLTRNDE